MDLVLRRNPIALLELTVICRVLGAEVRSAATKMVSSPGVGKERWLVPQLERRPVHRGRPLVSWACLCQRASSWRRSCQVDVGDVEAGQRRRYDGQQLEVLKAVCPSLCAPTWPGSAALSR